MRSTGEVMGIARDFPTAFAKAQAAAGASLPTGGTVFLTVTDSDKAAVHGIASTLHDLGFRIVATRGTAQAIRSMGVPCEALNKVGEGSPHVVDWIERGDVDLVVNTPTGSGARTDGLEIRRAAVAAGVPCITTISSRRRRRPGDRGRAPARARPRCSRCRRSTRTGRPLRCIEWPAALAPRAAAVPACRGDGAPASRSARCGSRSRSRRCARSRRRLTRPDPALRTRRSA